MEVEYEGAYSEASFGTVVGLLENEEENARLERRLNKHMASELDGHRKANQLGVFINCWHMSEYESQALWKIYSRVGIAVQSTFVRLAQSFNEPDEKIYVSEGEYANYSETPIRWDADDWALPSLSKRQQFEYGRELRAVVAKPPLINGELNTEATDHPKGCARGVDLRALIERV